jgi:prepilin-type N-terminal cleavage/methylation domain-containing protein
MKNRRMNRTLRPAFTLIEMMIVIALIGLLAALTLGISSSVLRNSEIRQTENALRILSMAMQEWELEKGRSMEFQGVPVNNDTGMYDLLASGFIDYPGFGGAGITNETMASAMKSRAVSFAYVLSQSESAKSVLSKIESDLMDKDNDGPFVIDAWGNPIGVVFPGKYYYDVFPGGNMFAEDASGDLTVRDDVEDGLGSCINQMPYYVSAGPDGIWGYRFQANNGPVDPSDAMWKATLDNIYSYKPYLVEGAR